MDEKSIELENERLKSCWNCFPAEHLADYLGIEEQDQRINTHSILTRALLADTFWPGRFDALIDEELRFGVVMTWLLQKLKAGSDRVQLLEELDGSRSNGRLPEFMWESFHRLQVKDCPIPDYISEALIHANSDQPNWYLFEPVLDIFRSIWSSQLAELDAKCVDVLEPACGSGNDYKAIRDFGLGVFISYSGFDISWKNISNACRRFPGIRFFEASILNSGLADESFDYIFVHDVLGHLSPKGLAVAIAEISRIVRKEAWLHCYNVADIDQHEVRPRESYFRNRLSISQIVRSFEQQGASVEFIDISDLLNRKFSYIPPYTATSGSFIVRKA